MYIDLLIRIFVMVTDKLPNTATPTRAIAIILTKIPDFSFLLPRGREPKQTQTADPSTVASFAIVNGTLSGFHMGNPGCGSTPLFPIMRKQAFGPTRKINRYFLMPGTGQKYRVIREFIVSNVERMSV